MRAIVNGKLYDTEKATKKLDDWISIPKRDKNADNYVVYETAKGNIFARNLRKDILIDAGQIQELLNRDPKSVDTYIEIFGMPEEA